MTTPCQHPALNLVIDAALVCTDAGVYVPTIFLTCNLCCAAQTVPAPPDPDKWQAYDSDEPWVAVEVEMGVFD